MKKTRNTILFLLIILTTISCSKDNDNSQQMYFTSYSYSFFSEEFQLNYNANNTLIAFETLNPTTAVLAKKNNEISRNENGLLTNVDIATFTYNGLNQITSINDGTGNGTTEIQYDGTGKLIKQNTTYFGGSITETKDLTYDSNNKVTKIIIHIISAAINTYYKYNITYNVQNNISEINLSSSTDNITYELLETKIYTYDAKLNPLKTVTKNMGLGNFYIAPSLQFSLFKTIDFNYLSAYALHWISNNNILNTTTISASGYSTNSSYDYTYNLNGYPKTVNITDEDGDSYTENFFYTIK